MYSNTIYIYQGTLSKRAEDDERRSDACVGVGRDGAGGRWVGVCASFIVDVVRHPGARGVSLPPNPPTFLYFQTLNLPSFSAHLLCVVVRRCISNAGGLQTFLYVESVRGSFEEKVAGGDCCHRVNLVLRSPRSS